MFALTRDSCRAIVEDVAPLLVVVAHVPLRVALGDLGAQGGLQVAVPAPAPRPIARYPVCPHFCPSLIPPPLPLRPRPNPCLPRTAPRPVSCRVRAPPPPTLPIHPPPYCQSFHARLPPPSPHFDPMLPFTLPSAHPSSFHRPIPPTPRHPAPSLPPLPPPRPHPVSRACRGFRSPGAILARSHMRRAVQHLVKFPGTVLHCAAAACADPHPCLRMTLTRPDDGASCVLVRRPLLCCGFLSYATWRCGRMRFLGWAGRHIFT